jgi:4-hydroxybenzoate polyprenyltransferase
MALDTSIHTGKAGSESRDWSGIPLFVDLDGTLIDSDSLHESLCLLCKSHPLLIFMIPFWVLKGKAYFKAKVAEHVDPDVSTWPYNQALLHYLKQQRSAGRTMFLASAANIDIVSRVANHLALFDGTIGSDQDTNCSGTQKLRAIQRHVGNTGFSYAGNDRKDLNVWSEAEGALIVNASRTVERQARRLTKVERVIPPTHPSLLTYLKGIRVHQWLKNMLVFLPLLPVLSHLEPAQFSRVLVAFFAFSFTGSSVYVMNDFLDLESDRKHPRKRRRPFASGAISIKTGLVLSLLFLLGGFLLALWISPAFAGVLLFYFVVTTAYSVRLKRTPIVDVIVLAMLYTVRVLAGAVAADLPITFWILAFSVFLFLSLALVKRCAELRTMIKEGKTSAAGRGYRVEDEQVLQSLGTASGLMSVVVLGVYITQPKISEAFARPDILGLLCLILLYWIGRVWIKAHRGKMHDDPVLFAVRDRISQYLVVIGALIVAAAAWL